MIEATTGTCPASDKTSGHRWKQ